MRKIILFLGVFLGMWTVSIAQTTTILKTFQSFTSIKAHNGVLVDLIPADTLKAEINFKNVSASDIICEVDNNNLVIKIDGNIMEREDVFIKVYYTELYRIEAFTNAEINGDKLIKQEQLTVNAKSGGEVYLDIDVQRLQGNATKGGIVHLEGYADQVTFKASSKGSLVAFDLETQHADLRANLGGSIKIAVEESLKAKATMNGAINYKGRPTIEVQKVNLGGELNHLTD